MERLENDIDRRNIELANNNPELQKRTEKEAKYDPTDPEVFAAFKDIAVPIEQIYLSHPDEQFSLRVRAEYNLDGTIAYSAALKDTGKVVDGERHRLEIFVKDLSPEAFAFYQAQPQFPRVYKMRAKPVPGVDIDFIEGRELPIVEIENTEDSQGDAFRKEYGDFLLNRSHDQTMENEWIAHSLHPHETLKPKQETNEQFVERVMNEMVARYAVGHNQVVVGLSGMSGSGKSTMARLLSERIVEVFGQEFAPAVISTDDYHFGKKALEEMYGAPYVTWDAPRTYNLPLLAEHLKGFAQGESFAYRHFDFATEEAIEDGPVSPSPFVILEGLYADSPELSSVRNVHEELPVGLATSIGRDARRLAIENRANHAFPTPEDRVRYQLEVALPTYLEQERPLRNSFSAHSRPLAQRAFMLERLTALAG